MKTGFDIQVGSVAIEVNGQVVNTPEINIKSNIEFTLGEAKGMYELQKEVLAELPELFKEFAIKFTTTMREVDDHVEATYADRASKETEEN